MTVTHRDLADAADELIQVEDEARRYINAMVQILRRDMRPGGTSRAGPLFPFIGNEVAHKLDLITRTLADLHNLVAVQAYDERRKAEKVEALVKEVS